LQYVHVLALDALLPGSMVSSAEHRTVRPVHSPWLGTRGKQLIYADNHVSTYVFCTDSDKTANVMFGNLAELDTGGNILYERKHSRQALSPEDNCHSPTQPQLVLE
jgi:hypothetical protein